MKKLIRIIGIDPGLRHTGWGIIEVCGNGLHFIASGSISPEADMPMAQRLRMLYECLRVVFLKYDPHQLALEQVFVNKNAHASLKLGQARAIGLLAAGLSDVPVSEYAPNKVKQAIVGVGHSEKQQIYKMVKLLLPRAQMQTSDEADALAIAICHAHYGLLTR